MLTYLESGTPASAHAAQTVRDPVDRVQQRRLRKLGLRSEDALERYNLAPLETRRDIALFAVLHKIVLGIAPLQLAALFRREPRPEPGRTPTRLLVRRHGYQLQQPLFRTDVLKRSLFGYVVVYNLLPPEVVEASSISAFQTALQRAVKAAAAKGIENWNRVLNPVDRVLRPAAFQALFA